MSLQASVRRVARGSPPRIPVRRTHQVTTGPVTRVAERLGLWTTQPYHTTRRLRYRPVHARQRRARIWTRVRVAVRLLFAPGLLYFVAALLAGTAAALLAGLWLL